MSTSEDLQALLLLAGVLLDLLEAVDRQDRCLPGRSLGDRALGH